MPSTDGSRVRIGIAGLGAAGQAFIPAIRRHEGFDWVALADPVQVVRERTQREHGVVAYASLPELLGHPGLDAVYLATPTPLHADHVLQVAAAGKHVLVEKPMAITLEQGRAMVDAAQQAGVILLVGHSHSYDTPIKRMRELIASGELGRVRMVNTWCFTDWLYRPRRPDEFDAEQGGGVTFRQGSHQFDVIRLLCGGQASSVRAKTFDWNPRRPAIGAHIVFLEFDNGAAATAVYNGYGGFSSMDLCSDISEWGFHQPVHQRQRTTVPSTGLSQEEELRAKQARAQRHSGWRAVPAVFRAHPGELRAGRHSPVAHGTAGLHRSRPASNRVAGGPNATRTCVGRVSQCHHRSCASVARRPLGTGEPGGLRRSDVVFQHWSRGATRGTSGGASMMMSLEVVRKAAIADDVHLFELALAGRQPLPAFSAGSHVTVLTPNGMTRRYSLCNGPDERDRYVIAVKRDAQGRSGSVSLIDHVAVGDVLMVSAPLNYFPLDAKAGSHLLIAGGIGITPILSMVRELQARQAEFRVIYATRSPQATAFLELLCEPDFGGRVRFHHDHGDRTRSLDLVPVLSHQPAGAHLYCCGPRPLMQAVRDCTRHWPAASVHFEDFGTSEQPEQPVDRPFVVRLVRTGVTVEVPRGVSILEALRRRGIAVPSSCESGTCGSCRTGLVAGIAQHRDYVLDEDQHDKEIMICVSRAESPVLELDL